MNISIENLRHFCTLAELENINQSASLLSISPSAVSFSLSKIEAELGKPLFDRVGRTIVINAEGRNFAKKSQLVLDKFSELSLKDNATPGLSGSFVIGGSHSLMNLYVATICIDIQNENPEAQFEMRSMDTYALTSDLMTGQLDVAVAFSPDPHPHLTKEVLYRGELKIVVSKKHPLAGMKFKDWVNLINDYPYTAHKSGKLLERCDSHPMFSKYKIKPRINMLWDSDAVGSKVLQTTESWTLMPDIIADSERKTLVALDLPKDWMAPYELCLLYNKMSRNQVLVNSIRDRILQSFG